MSRRTLLTLAIVYLGLGLLAGLLGGWAWQSASTGCQIVEMAPAYMDAYVLMVAEAYASTGDREAVSCLFLGLSEDDIAHLVDAASRRMVAAPDVDEKDTAAMITLASAFGRERFDLLAYAATPLLTSVASTSPAWQTAAPTELAGTTGRLSEQQWYVVTRAWAICAADEGARRVEVWVEDETGQPLAGVHIRVIGDEVTENAVTGLARASDPGYADFVLEEGKTYRLTLLDEQGNRAGEEIRLPSHELGCSFGQHTNWRIHLSRVKRD